MSMPGTSAAVDCALSCPPEASAHSSCTVSPDSISSTGVAALSHTNAASLEPTEWSECECPGVAKVRQPYRIRGGSFAWRQHPEPVQPVADMAGRGQAPEDRGGTASGR